MLVTVNWIHWRSPSVLATSYKLLNASMLS